MAKVLEPQQVPPQGRAPPLPFWHHRACAIPAALPQTLQGSQSLCTYLSTHREPSPPRCSLTSFSVRSHPAQLLSPSVVGTNIEWTNMRRALCTVPGARLCLGAAAAVRVHDTTGWEGLFNLHLSLCSNGRLRVYDAIGWQGIRGGQSEIMTLLCCLEPTNHSSPGSWMDSFILVDCPIFSGSAGLPPLLSSWVDHSKRCLWPGPSVPPG